MGRHFGQRSMWAGVNQTMAKPMGGEILAPSKKHVPTQAPFRGTPPSGLSRMVPSGSPGGPARAPNVPRSRLDPGMIAGLQRAAQQAGAAGRRARGLLRRLGLFGQVLETVLTLDDWLNGNLEWMKTTGFNDYRLPGGWSRCPNPSTCNWAPTTWDWWGSGNGAGVCQAFGGCPTLQVSQINNPLGDTSGFPANTNLVVFGRPNPVTPNRWDFQAQFRRTTVYDGQPQSYPAFGRTQPLNRAVPRGEPVQLTYREVKRGPYLKPYQRLGREYPGGRPVIHDVLPPPIRDDKWIFRDPAIARVYGAITELMDFQECLSEASNNAGRSGPFQKRLWELGREMINNPEGFDRGKFFRCMLENQASDALIGKANRKVNEALRAAHDAGYSPNRPFGYGRGSFGRRMG